MFEPQSAGFSNIAITFVLFPYLERDQREEKNSKPLLQEQKQVLHRLSASQKSMPLFLEAVSPSNVVRCGHSGNDAIFSRFQDQERRR